LPGSSKAQARPAAFLTSRATCRTILCRVLSNMEAVLSAGSDATVGITTALQGADGYGKTTLANALCRDPDIRFEFTDGILRVEIGKERNDVTGLVVDLIEKLDPNARRPGFQDVQTASEHLGEPRSALCALPMNSGGSRARPTRPTGPGSSPRLFSGARGFGMP
jgi:hypothetical protein